jgi:hypothetical protein
MKKLITLAIVSSMLISAPVLAQNNDRNDRRQWNDQNQRRGGGCGWLCGAIIGGVVVGALSSNNSRERRQREQFQDFDSRYYPYPPDYRYDRRYCVREQITEWYQGERYVYWETRCN